MARRALPDNLRSYVMVLYHRPEVLPEDLDVEATFDAHLTFLDDQRARGANVCSGPFLDDGPLRGISIYDATDVEAIANLVANDPAVLAGALHVEVRPWMRIAGSTLPG